MDTVRKKILVRGIVQGVGFRPFVYREALAENLKGFVSNSSTGVEIEVEGPAEAISTFLERVRTNPPPLAQITDMTVTDLSATGDMEFLIVASHGEEKRTALISPDVSICDDCLKELFDPEDRRFRYPFINCTNCGPRYTIIQDIPYDRPMTTMSVFAMCADCQAEYDDPANRRFHAQPNACPVCGPRVWITDERGKSLDIDDPIKKTVDALREGKIVAVKGLGGFHLACDATNAVAVRRLRERKHREEKPLAVMVMDIPRIEQIAELSQKERDLLVTPRRPIVLLMKKQPFPLAEDVAPGNPTIGVMLPYTPLHYLVLKEGFTALVMTSGNLSEEPIAIDNEEALKRLEGIADFYLMHDRDIHVRSDDSVSRVAAGLPRPIRRSRGYVPVPVFLRKEVPSVLAVGGELKNTICLTKGDRAFLSQHIGDLENMETLGFFEECVGHLSGVLEIEPSAIVYDMHPDYLSSQWAKENKALPLIAVQHHHAHIASCLAENGRDDRVIGLSMDGTGYGADGKVWGGEVLLADLNGYERAGHFAYRPMPGGASAIKEPWRMALVYLLYASGGSSGENLSEYVEEFSSLLKMYHVSETQLTGIVRMMEAGVNLVKTSSLGRLFDGIAAIAGIRNYVAFEGQAAMELEMAMGPNAWMNAVDEPYSFDIQELKQRFIIDPDPVIRRIHEDVIKGIPIKTISLQFHEGVVDVLKEACIRIREHTGLGSVALSGGCFQNRYLLERLIQTLTDSDFEVITHSQVPANDGGLALGQAAVASYQLA